LNQDRLVKLLESFYDPEIKKELKLLKILEYQDSWLSLQELQTISGFSRPTIIKYLNHYSECSNDYPSFCLKVDKKKGYCLEIYESFHYGQYYRNQLYKMWPIQLIKELILKKTMNKNFFVENFFISESSLKQKIRQIRKLLKVFNLELAIDNGNYYLVGAEANIRRLAKEFFWEFFKGSIWPFETVNEGTIIEKARMILNSNYADLSLIEQRQLHYHLAIQEIRCTNSFFFEVQPLLAPLVPILEQSVTDLSNQAIFFPSLNELYYFYFLLATKTSYYPFFKFNFLPAAEKDERLSRLATLNTQIIDYINGSIKEMTLEQTHFFCDFLFSTHVTLEMYGNTYSLNSNRLKQNRSTKLNEHLKNILALIDAQFSLTADIAEFLSYRYESILLQTFPPNVFQPEIKIGFCTDLDVTLERKLIELLKVYFFDLYNVRFSSGINKNDAPLDLVVHTSLSPEVFLTENVKQTVYLDIRSLYRSDLTELINLITQYILKMQSDVGGRTVFRPAQ